jgi:hypothetical protein
MDKPLGSSGSIKALLAGAIDIAVVSRRLKPEEINRGGEKGLWQNPLVIVVEKSNRLKTISRPGWKTSMPAGKEMAGWGNDPDHSSSQGGYRNEDLEGSFSSHERGRRRGAP